MNNQILKKFPILKNASVLQAIKCIGQNHGNFVCMEKGCQFYPFMCIDKKCICKKDHGKCLKILAQDFLQKLTNKTLIQDIDKHIENTNKMIDQFAQKIIKSSLQLKKLYQKVLTTKLISFSQDQKKLLTQIQTNNVKDLKGKNFYKVYEQIKKQQNSFTIQKEIQQLKVQWIKFEQKIWTQINFLKFKWNQQNNQVKFQQNFFSIQEKNLMKNSKIVVNHHEQQIIKGFFHQKIIKVQLLYRASQNQFKLKNFYQKCKEIKNTLILIQTQNNKKIGGFTPLIWHQIKQSSQKQFVSDKSFSTFLFSLTHNEKLIQKDQTCGIQNLLNYGPRFAKQLSKGASLAIYECANTINKSYIQINNGYVHKNYTQDKKLQGIQRLTGSNNIYFLIKEWEVWSISFFK